MTPPATRTLHTLFIPPSERANIRCKRLVQTTFQAPHMNTPRSGPAQSHALEAASTVSVEHAAPTFYRLREHQTTDLTAPESQYSSKLLAYWHNLRASRHSAVFGYWLSRAPHPLDYEMCSKLNQCLISVLTGARSWG
jgi:hypothetical protein